MLAVALVRSEAFDRVLGHLPRAVRGPDGGPLPARLVVDGDCCSVIAPAGEGVYVRVSGLCLDEASTDRVVALDDLVEALATGGDLDALSPFPEAVVLPAPPADRWVERGRLDAPGLEDLFEDVAGLLADARERIRAAAAGADLTDPALAASFEAALSDGLAEALRAPAAWLERPRGADPVALPGHLAFALRTFTPDADPVVILSAGCWLLAQVAGGFEAYLAGGPGGQPSEPDALADPSSR